MIQWSSLSWPKLTLKSYKSQSSVGKSYMGTSLGELVSGLACGELVLFGASRLFREAESHHVDFPSQRFDVRSTIRPREDLLWYANSLVSLRYRRRDGDLWVNSTGLL